MPRIRTIKPEFFTSLTVAGLSLEARLTFIGLWTHCDDEGRCVDDARLIKAAVWPLDDRIASDVELDLKALNESSLILRYTVGERSYLTVRGWREHQRINRPTRSKLPPPPPAEKPAQEVDVDQGDPGLPAETSGPVDVTDNSVSPHGRGTEGSRQERNREQGTGKGKEHPPPPASRPDAEVLDAEIVADDTPNLPARLGDIENAGQITKQWIDHCTERGVKLTDSIIKRYAKGIGDARKQGFAPQLIKTALGQMLDDNEAARPSLLDNYLVRAQTGPAKGPRRMTRTEASMTSNGSPTAAFIRDALTRPA